MGGRARRDRRCRHRLSKEGTFRRYVSTQPFVRFLKGEGVVGARPGRGGRYPANRAGAPWQVWTAPHC